MTEKPIILGGMDQRKLNVVVEGRRLFVPDPRLAVSTPLPITEILAVNLQGREGISEEIFESLQRSATIVEGMEDLGYEDKLRLFLYGAWEEGPVDLIHARTLLNVRESRAIEYIHQAIEDKRFKYQILRYNYLIKPNALEVRDLRRQGLRNPGVASRLDIPLQEARRIAQDLLLLEEIEPDPAGIKQNERFKLLCDSVEYYDEQKLTVKEIAELLGENPLTVGYARKRLIAVGRIARRSMAEVAKKRFPDAAKNRKKVELFRLTTSLTIKQIAEKIHATEGIAQHNARYLVRKERIPRKGKGNPRKIKIGNSSGNPREIMLGES